VLSGADPKRSAPWCVGSTQKSKLAGVRATWRPPIGLPVSDGAAAKSGLKAVFRSGLLEEPPGCGRDARGSVVGIGRALPRCPASGPVGKKDRGATRRRFELAWEAYVPVRGEEAVSMDVPPAPPEERFKLSLSGNGVDLWKLPAREWLDLLKQILAGVESVAAARGAADQGRFALVGLEAASVDAVLVPLDAEAGPCLRSMTIEMAAGRAHRLPPKVRQAAEAVAHFSEQCEGRVIIEDMSRQERIAVLDAGVRPRTRIFKELTVIYGRPFRVGGKSDPGTIYVETEPGPITIVCQASRAQIRKVAGRLWEPIGLRGVATRVVDTNEVKRFVVDEILPYEPIEPWRALEELRRAAGPDLWGNDPVAAIARFRRGEAAE
jgi:hypothetical protein